MKAMLVWFLVFLALSEAAPSKPQRCSKNQHCGDRGICLEGMCISEDFAKGSSARLCTTVYDPVCSCDGITYSNRCIARARNVDCIRSGECKSVDKVGRMSLVVGATIAIGTVVIIIAALNRRSRVANGNQEIRNFQQLA
eukprot:c32612_g1_i1.p1 GENE.c32612_g1_i1~~c32612_g1_i1.p1  ORF type:complete len:140 (+),score=13.35 c32612_g1_i1:36-455(+)